MDDYLKYIEEQLSGEDNFVGEYSIKAKWAFGETPSRLMEVSRLFSSPEELREAGIPKESRSILAYSPLGFNKLIELGFSKREIVKQYGDISNTNSDRL